MKKVSSFLSSPRLLKNIKLQFFKKKKNSGAGLKHRRSVYSTCNNVLYGSYTLVNWLKVTYKNAFVGFFESADGAVFLKNLNYGFSFTKIYENFFLKSYQAVEYKKIYETYINDAQLNEIYLRLANVGGKIWHIKISNFNKYYARSSGTFCVVLNKEFSKQIVFLRLPSKKQIFVDFYATACAGRVSNIFFKYSVFSSFGNYEKVKHKRQSVRGIAKNPVDHPNGGRSKVKKPFKNPWGSIAKYGK